MAFGFFRRNQKMVMIIMAVLMVSFLISFQGFNSIFSPKAGNVVVCTTRYGDLKQSDMTIANNDLRILGYIRLLDPRYRMAMGMQPDPTDQDVIFSEISNSPNPTQEYSLLLQEALNYKTQVSDQEIDTALDQFGYTVNSPAYKEFIASLRADKSGSEKQLRQAIRNWLAIYKTALSAVADIPPSDIELKLSYKELAERIALQVAAISADDLAKTVELTPTTEQIDAQFKTYANVTPGSNGVNDLGFGYRQANRASIDYIYASQAVLARAAEPTELQLMEYWRTNANEMVDVEQSGASKPASAASSEPAEESETSTIQRRLGDLKPAQAKAAIIKLMTPNEVLREMEAIFSAIDGIEQSMGAAASADPKLYETIASRLKIPADDALKTPLKTPIQNVSLQEAMSILTKDMQEAGLNYRLICFPMGKHGKITIDPAVIVSVDNKDQKATIGSALKQISTTLGLPIDNWASCPTMADVLFPLPPSDDYYDFFPVVARQTELMDAQEFTGDPILGNCYTTATGTRGAIGEFAFQAEAFYPQAKGAHMKLGQKGLLMYVRGEHPGRLIWKLVDAKPAEQPKEITPKIREQIIKDLKLQVAMTQAIQKGQALKAAADKEGLDKAALADGIKLSDVEFSRKFYSQQYGTFIPSMIPQLGIPYQYVPAFIDAAFKLAPAVVEPTTQGYGKSDIAVMSLPALHKVLVMQRSGFTPAVQADYVRLRPTLADFVMDFRRKTSVRQWLDRDNINARLDYKSARPE